LLKTPVSYEKSLGYFLRSLTLHRSYTQAKKNKKDAIKLGRIGSIDRIASNAPELAFPTRKIAHRTGNSHTRLNATMPFL
jgi:hypothetical protein